MSHNNLSKQCLCALVLNINFTLRMRIFIRRVRRHNDLEFALSAQFRKIAYQSPLCARVKQFFDFIDQNQPIPVGINKKKLRNRCLAAASVIAGLCCSLRGKYRNISFWMSIGERHSSAIKLQTHDLTKSRQAAFVEGGC
jgi:hypothetical protein